MIRVLILFVLSALHASEPGMVFVPAGEFLRGRNYDHPDTKLAWYPNPLKDDTPVRGIYLDPFYLDKTEVTIGAYAEFVKAARHRPPPVWPNGQPVAGKEKMPVADVSWDDASAYCEWRGKRLPTEAEWERAARGIGESQNYPWGDAEPKPANARFGVLEGPAAVCSYPVNGLGLCDMAGNVWEWTADWYGKDYYAAAPGRNPAGPETGIYRVLRGGSWFDTPNPFLRCSYRSWARPAERSPNVGFRCAKSFYAKKVLKAGRTGSK
jgi:formylglycine-generating enzyme required for sulfatase activity